MSYLEPTGYQVVHIFTHCENNFHVFYFCGFGFLRKLSNHENFQIYDVIKHNVQTIDTSIPNPLNLIVYNA